MCIGICLLSYFFIFIYFLTYYIMHWDWSICWNNFPSVFQLTIIRFCNCKWMHSSFSQESATWSVDLCVCEVWNIPEMGKPPHQTSLNKYPPPPPPPHTHTQGRSNSLLEYGCHIWITVCATVDTSQSAFFFSALFAHRNTPTVLYRVHFSYAVYCSTVFGCFKHGSVC